VARNEIDCVVERPFARSETRDGEERGHQVHDVFPALGGAPEHEETGLAVVRDERDEQRPDERARGERSEQPQDQRRAGDELGDTREPGVEDARLHPETLEPSPGTGDLAPAEDVVVPVRDHRAADGDAQDEKAEIDLVGCHGRAQ